MIAIGQITIADMNDITVSATAPINASNGLLWLNSTTKELKMYSDGNWINATKYTDDTNLIGFINNTYNPEIESIENELDTKIETWYYSGVPTLVNEPADNWNTSEERNKHIGDLYYDRSTGYCYRFQGTGTVYSWQRIIDSDLTEALAIANAASDTADSKRRIFTAQPTPPYDNGDLWFSDNEIYICQISKGEGETYEELDFIVATKYTDDTIAIKVQDNLEVLRGTVLKIKESTDEYKIQFDTSIKAIHNDTKEITEALETMSYSFGTNDLVIANSNDPVNARINNQGLKVYSFNTLKQITNHNGVGAEDLIVVGEAQLGNLRFTKSTDENNKPCTEIHHLISNIQTLEDLE